MLYFTRWCIVFVYHKNVFLQIFIIILLLVVFFILGFMFIVQRILTRSSSTSDPQFTSIESGFERLNYSMFLRASFFMLAVLFVLFDLELLLLLPFVFFSLKQSFIFIVVLFVVLRFVSISLF